ncbi:TetR/AcrR family transcriptional regulator [Halobacterium sp. KA-4]|uniref:TetR/AcrR family transcriptional regulator n=1 Tax=Halobacterium sp. KA-4 TaxID=2896367 RepID=UPI001E3CD85F|nr:TetR/AcrR family transcriptional regulator [Halobacterium sp. KA-4]MCD2200493.1 TetR/AcrR family transcriptional regulator [Halobacterium sp. KA-4]
MSDSNPFDSESTDTKSAIMRATFETLDEYGYTGLSMSRIADRADISKSSLYHHYSDKDALLYEFLERIIAQLTEEFSLLQFDDPVTALETLLMQGVRGRFPDQRESGQIIDNVTPPHTTPEQSHETFIELRAQGVHDEVYREKITELDQTIETHIETIIRSGIEQGVFRDVDPEPVAQTLLTLVLGGIVRRTSSETTDLPEVYNTVHDCIDQHLLSENESLNNTDL